MIFYLSSFKETILGFFFFFFFGLFTAAPVAHGGSQARGWIRATATGLHHSYSNAGFELRFWPTPQLTDGSLTHWVRPGIEPATSWFLVGFASASPQRELPSYVSFLFLLCQRELGSYEVVFYGNHEMETRMTK